MFPLNSDSKLLGLVGRWAGEGWGVTGAGGRFAALLESGDIRAVLCLSDHTPQLARLPVSFRPRRLWQVSVPVTWNVLPGGVSK